MSNGETCSPVPGTISPGRRRWDASGNLGHIDELIVDKKFRGQGIGQSLLEKMTEIARENDCKRIELDSAFNRREAHVFYEKSGFENRAYLFSKKLDTSAWKDHN